MFFVIFEYLIGFTSDIYLSSIILAINIFVLAEKNPTFFKNKNCNIDLIHPKMKTSMIGKEADNIIKNKKNKTERKQYLTTKHLGIIFTQYILEHEVDNYNEWIDTFKDKKKQDDLCDSFLHAYYLLYGPNCKIDDKEFIDYVHNEINKMDNNIKSAKLSK